MRLNLICLVVVYLASHSAAQADEKYTCTNPQQAMTNNLTVTGSGTTAKIHMSNTLMSADLTYNDAYTQLAVAPGYDVFTGSATDYLDTPPTQAEAAFFFQPSLLTGGLGSMEQFSVDSLVILDCVKAQ